MIRNWAFVNNSSNPEPNRDEILHNDGGTDETLARKPWAPSVKVAKIAPEKDELFVRDTTPAKCHF